MRKLYIIGAGEFGRELFAWLEDIKNRDWEFAGFLDDNLAALEGHNIGAKVLGQIKTYIPGPQDCFIITVGHVETKAKLAKQLQQKGAQFISVIHPTSVISRYVKLGKGCVFYPFSYVGTGAVVGDFVTLNVHASVGHDAIVGNYSTLSGHCDITGNVKLGEGVFMGTHAAVIPKITIGDYATIAAGSVAMRNVKPHTTVIGVPAKLL